MTACEMAIHIARNTDNYLFLEINNSRRGDLIEIGNKKTGKKITLDVGFLPACEIFEYLFKYAIEEGLTK